MQVAQGAVAMGPAGCALGGSLRQEVRNCQPFGTARGTGTAHWDTAEPVNPRLSHCQTIVMVTQHEWGL